MADATVDDLRAWSRAYGWRNMNGLCQAYAWQLTNAFGDAPVTYPSATAARQASPIHSTNPDEAEFGDYAYWSNVMVTDPKTGRRYDAGHVALMLGPDDCAMASSRIREPWGWNTGRVGVRAYTRSFGSSGPRFEGISRVNGRNDIRVARVARPNPFELPEKTTPAAIIAQAQKDPTMTQLLLLVDDRSGTVNRQLVTFDFVNGLVDPFTGTGLSVAVATRMTGQEDPGAIKFVTNEERNQLDNWSNRNADVLADRLRARGIG